MTEHAIWCPRLQYWDAGEWQAPCLCEGWIEETPHYRIERDENGNPTIHYKS